MAAAVFALMVLAPPTPEVETGGLPMSLWANLPVLVCGVFLIATLVGILIVVRENRRVAERQLLGKTRDDSSDPEQG